jgi:dienelactone hydrolase
VFEYFPDNYSWSLSAHMAIDMGGQISEVDEVCRPLQALAADGELHAEAWFAAWAAMGDRLERLARADEAAGRSSAAGRKLLRAAAYLLLAERQIVDKSDRTQDAYRRGVELFARGAECSGLGVERVEVPFGDTSMPALFIGATAADGPAPAVIHFSGLDVNKEIIFMMGARDLPRHGVSVLICDHPGVGESLRFRGLHATHASEIPASACVDFLEGRADVDAQRIGIMALSLGGYYAPRAAAFEPRLKCCVLWGAIWSVPELLEWVRTQDESEVSVPLDEQFRWVMGAASVDAAREQLADWELADVMHRIRVPVLTVHGANDRQAPLFVAERTHAAAVNSPRRELRAFALDEGGAEHCQIDNPTMGTDYMCAWIADVLGGDPSGLGQSRALRARADGEIPSVA